jgi:hypothetical protein
MAEGFPDGEQARGEEATMRLQRGDVARDGGTTRERGGEVDDNPKLLALVEVVMDLSPPLVCFPSGQPDTINKLFGIGQ